MPRMVGNGTTLGRATVQAGPFTAVAHIVDFDGPSAETAEVDISDLDSQAREFLPGLRDFGDLTMAMNIDFQLATQFQQLQADQAAGTVAWWELEFPDDADAGVTTPTTAVFPAFVKSLPVTGGVDAPVQGSITLRISGDVTWDYGA